MIQAVLVETQGVGLHLRGKLLHHLSYPLGRDFADLWQQYQSDRISLTGNQLGKLHALLGQAMLLASNHLLVQNRQEPDRVMAIGYLGPLLWHDPQHGQVTTHDLGMTAVLADRLGISVVSDFREIDIAGGGQGMPISALADGLLYRSEKEHRLLLHLGSMASMLYLPPGGKAQDLLAAEIVPCNSLLDRAIRQGTAGREKFDNAGRIAVQGTCLDSLIARWQEDPSLQRKPPRSIARKDFGNDFLQHAFQLTAQNEGTLQDLLCTLSHFIVRTIIHACCSWLPVEVTESARVNQLGSVGDPPLRTVNSSMTGSAIEKMNVYLSGGGVANGMLLRLLKYYAPGWEFKKLDELGFSATARTATGAAIMAALTLDGVPVSTPSGTGTVGRMLGRITPGHPGNWAKCLRWMGEHVAEIHFPYRAA